MNIPSYLSIGTVKGFNKEKKEWVYGWHWTEVPYTCFDEGQKIKHYVRVQRNLDWNLTEQIDYEVETDSVSQYIGKKDINGIPLFLGDKIKFYFGNEFHYGRIQFDINTLSYIVIWDNLNRTELKYINNIEFIDARYNSEDK